MTEDDASQQRQPTRPANMNECLSDGKPHERLRFSLRALFGLVAYGSAMSWSLAQMGTGQVDFWLANLASLAAVCGLVAMTGSDRLRGYSILPSALLVFAICIAGAGVAIVMTNAVLLFIAGLIFTGQPPQPFVRRLGLGLLCHALGNVCGACPAIFARREWLALHREFPVESLAGRLAYESRERVSRGGEPSETSKPAWAPLTGWDALYSEPNYRETRLRSLHHMRYESFVKGAGFGLERIAWPKRETLAWPPLRDIEPDEAASNAEQESRSQWLEEVGDTPASAIFHRRSQWNFMEPRTFGAVLASRERVAGFVPHAFQSPPAAWKPDEVGDVRRVQLVSLLKFDSPRVYVLDHLPRMDQLSRHDAPTRTLDDFEATALERLRTSREEVVVDERGSELRMLGALRAGRKCQQCHRVEYGELLGAFSYVLAPREQDSP